MQGKSQPAKKGMSVSALIRSEFPRYQDEASGLVRSKDLRHLAKESALHQSLRRLCRDGTLHRVSRGVYRMRTSDDDATTTVNRMLERYWFEAATPVRELSGD
jgi:hypothetical protein